MQDDQSLPASHDTLPAPRPKGFARLAPDVLSAIARKGGKAAHAVGRAHEFTSEEAREAGRKGGAATWRKRRAQRNGGVVA
jgi:general stress protein YciG